MLNWTARAKYLPPRGVEAVRGPEATAGPVVGDCMIFRVPSQVCNSAQLRSIVHRPAVPLYSQTRPLGETGPGPGAALGGPEPPTQNLGREPVGPRRRCPVAGGVVDPHATAGPETAGHPGLG